MQFRHPHLDSFLVNCDAVSDEDGERFHEDISAMDNRHNNKWTDVMLADYCLTVKKNAPEIQYNNQKGASFNSHNSTVMSCFHTAI
jgi:hypothetical protein